jgi:hypothetical protein
MVADPRKGLFAFPPCELCRITKHNCIDGKKDLKIKDFNSGAITWCGSAMLKPNSRCTCHKPE